MAIRDRLGSLWNRFPGETQAEIVGGGIGALGSAFGAGEDREDALARDRYVRQLAAFQGLQTSPYSPAMGLHQANMARQFAQGYSPFQITGEGQGLRAAGGILTPEGGFDVSALSPENLAAERARWEAERAGLRGGMPGEDDRKQGGGFWSKLGKIGLGIGSVALPMATGGLSLPLQAALGAGMGAAGGALGGGGWRGAAKGGALGAGGGLLGGYLRGQAGMNQLPSAASAPMSAGMAGPVAMDPSRGAGMMQAFLGGAPRMPNIPRDPFAHRSYVVPGGIHGGWSRGPAPPPLSSRGGHVGPSYDIPNLGGLTQTLPPNPNTGVVGPTSTSDFYSTAVTPVPRQQDYVPGTEPGWRIGQRTGTGGFSRRRDKPIGELPQPETPMSDTARSEIAAQMRSNFWGRRSPAEILRAWGR
mgnify:CR=1 FL=1